VVSHIILLDSEVQRRRNISIGIAEFPRFVVSQGSSTAYPLPLGERDRVRGLARQREETSLASMQTRAASFRFHAGRALIGACQTPHPTPTPPTGEGTLLKL
jgi:hypothetical protein